jgi:predicted dehydrogenase
MQNMPDVEIGAIAEENSSSLSKVQNLGLPMVKDYKTLCADPTLDAIVVTTENKYHAPVAIDALEHGKHVIVEKPMATTLANADAMIHAAANSRGKLVQCYPCRYHPTAQAIKKECEKNSFGTILGISATNHGQMPSSQGVDSWFSNKELAGGGALMDHITHVADLIFWFTGAKLKSVFAKAANFFHPEVTVEDAGMVMLEYNNGMKASIDPSWSRPKNFATWGDVTMTIFGTQQTAWLDMFAQNIDIQRNQNTHAIWQNWGSDMDALMLRDFIDHLKRNEQPMLSGIDGRKALEVVIAAYESCHTGKVVHIN